MDPKQLVENVRKYWDEEPSLVNNSSVLQDPAPPGRKTCCTPVSKPVLDIDLWSFAPLAHPRLNIGREAASGNQQKMGCPSIAFQY